MISVSFEGQIQVVVAEHGGDGRDFFQLKRDERGADVARVQDVSDAREKELEFSGREIRACPR
jgi:hypothetical protein